uniref:Rubicon Homology domain-containing protein n=1 Tax=Timema genevievae TaxID=629358 RepID=A0A7R9K929_TIMGE|nr:unnamed protein product [Timema genevievae]
MAQLQALRHQLNLLRAYLFTCREPVIEDLQKRVWPREYLYEHVHLYSVALSIRQFPSYYHSTTEKKLVGGQEEGFPVVTLGFIMSLRKFMAEKYCHLVPLDWPDEHLCMSSQFSALDITS